MTTGRILPPAGWPIRTAAALFLVGAALRLRAWSFGESFWIDEVLSARAISAGVAGVLPRIAVDKPPLDYWLQALARDLGQPEFSHRLPALFAGILALPLAYLLGRVAHNWRVGLAMLALTSVSGVMVYYSAEARPYMPLVAIAFAQATAFAALWRMRSRPHRELLGGMALLLGLSVALVWTMYSGFLVIGAQAAFLAWYAATRWRSRTRRARDSARLCAALAAAILLLPALSILPLRTRMNLGPVEGFPFVYAGNHLYVAAQALSGSLVMHSALLGTQEVYHCTAAALILATIAPGIRHGGMRAAWAILVALAGVALIAGYAVIDREYYARYSLPCAPAVIMLVAVGLCRLARRLRPPFGALVIPTAVTLLLIALTPQEVRRPLRLDWKSGMEMVARRASPGEPLIVPSIAEEVPCLYYLQRAGRRDMPVLVQAEATRLDPSRPHWSLQVHYSLKGPLEKVRLGIRRVQPDPPAVPPGQWFPRRPDGSWTTLAGHLPDGPVSGGWSTAEVWGEPDGHIRWAMRQQCLLYLPLDAPPGRLTLELYPYDFPPPAVQGVTLAVNGQPLGRREIPPGRFHAASWDLPPRTPGAHGWCHVELRFDLVRSPSQDRRNYSDWRQLAAALGRITWEPAIHP